MDVVDILDSDEEQAVEQSNQEPEKTANDSKPENSPVNRPGPLSMKLKMGLSVERSDTLSDTNDSVSSAPDSDQDFFKMNKILTKLVDPNSKFLADFDPEQSIRERRKMVRKTTGPPIMNHVKPGTLYDENGIHRETGLDACDCLDLRCPGCHFPCPSCGNRKCGPQCRVNRKFIYESLLFDGKDIEVKSPLLRR